MPQLIYLWAVLDVVVISTIETFYANSPQSFLLIMTHYIHPEWLQVHLPITVTVSRKYIPQDVEKCHSQHISSSLRLYGKEYQDGKGFFCIYLVYEPQEQHAS